MISRAGAALALTSPLLLAPCAAAEAAGPCSADSFAVASATIALRVCDSPASKTGTGSVQETFNVKGRPPISRSVRYERLAGEETARTLDDVPLFELGIEKTMHVTLAIRGGTARTEHALLVPGAVPLK